MIVVVGASSSIAESVLEQLLEMDSVIATYFQTEIAYTSPRLIKKKLDLTDIIAVKAFADLVSKNYQNLTFINFASLSINKLFLTMQQEDWDIMHKVNVMSSVYILESILKTMIADRWGRVILVSSYVAEHGAVGAAGYATTKSSLLGLSRSLSQEYGRYGINSNILQLGYMNSGLIENVPEHKKKELLSRIPQRKFGSPDQVVNAIKYLLKADYVNGSILKIDGGL